MATEREIERGRGRKDEQRARNATAALGRRAGRP